MESNEKAYFLIVRWYFNEVPNILMIYASRVVLVHVSSCTVVIYSGDFFFYNIEHFIAILCLGNTASQVIYLFFFFSYFRIVAYILIMTISCKKTEYLV